MSFNRARFLIEVLGPDGARALAKAASRSEYLAQMVVPRTILAWLEASASYQGMVPGLDDAALTFTKAEDGFTGTITLSKTEGSTDYHFQAASIFHVAGALATAMELDSLVFGNARNTELNRLGKSIDMMAKMAIVNQSLEKAEKKGKCSECGATKGGHFDRLVAGIVLKCKNSKKELAKSDVDVAGSAGDKCEGPGTACHEHDPCDACVAAYEKKKKLEKKALGEGSGQAAGPVAPAAPPAPTATAPPATTAQKLPKNPGSSQGPKPVKLTRSETQHHCQLCSKGQFHDGKFVGCSCFSALAKSVKANWHPDETVDLTFGSDWDRESVLTLLEALGRK